MIIAKIIGRSLWLNSLGKVPICTSNGGAQGKFSESYENDEREEILSTKLSLEECKFGCTKCPYNKWRSDGKGRGKACVEKRVAFLLEEGSFIPVCISLPPTSIKSYDEFLTELTRQRIPEIFVTTVFSLTKTTSPSGDHVFSVISLKQGRLLSEEEIKKAREIRDKFGLVFQSELTEQLKEDKAEG